MFDASYDVALIMCHSALAVSALIIVAYAIYMLHWIIAGIILIRSKKGTNMAFWSKKAKTKTSTEEWIEFILLKMSEEPDEWTRDKYQTPKEWYEYKTTTTFVNALGEINDSHGVVPITEAQRKKLAIAIKNLRANKALRNMMKQAVKNTQ